MIQKYKIKIIIGLAMLIFIVYASFFDTVNINSILRLLILLSVVAWFKFISSTRMLTFEQKRKWYWRSAVCLFCIFALPFVYVFGSVQYSNWKNLVLMGQFEEFLAYYAQDPSQSFEDYLPKNELEKLLIAHGKVKSDIEKNYHKKLDELHYSVEDEFWKSGDVSLLNDVINLQYDYKNLSIEYYKQIMRANKNYSSELNSVLSQLFGDENSVNKTLHESLQSVLQDELFRNIQKADGKFYDAEVAFYTFLQENTDSFYFSDGEMHFENENFVNTYEKYYQESIDAEKTLDTAIDAYNKNRDSLLQNIISDA